MSTLIFPAVGLVIVENLVRPLIGKFTVAAFVLSVALFVSFRSLARTGLVL